VTKLETIDVLALSAITGGGNSTSWMQLNERVSTKSGLQNITKSSSSLTSDYETCVKAVSGMAGTTASDISSACGARSGATSASVDTSNRL
jgi:hypothetical protein